ncbi:MAG: hypothetical protein LUG13_07495 [Oscillospiraceae bacterium]|nr:hypothetical protein [Oscillospiraceae bacterium]
MQEGSFEKHIWKMKKYYGRNRSLLLAALSQQFPNQFTVLGHATGLHLVVRFQDRVFTGKTIHAIAARGVRVYRTGRFYLTESRAHNHEIMLGYSHLSQQEIADGIQILGKTI